MDSGVFWATRVSSQYLVAECVSSDAHLRMRTPLTSTYVYVRDAVGWRCLAGHTGPVP